MSLEKKREKNTGRFAIKHGLRFTNLYRIWENMKGRCNNPQRTNYGNYGGRGIKICYVWENDFKVFYDWSISNGYKVGLTLDRIDVNGDYTPENCRWADTKTQANNKRTSKFITFNGIKKTHREWEEEYGLATGTIRKRIKKGLEGNELICHKKPNGKINYVTHRGVTKSIKQWSIDLGINYGTLITRLTTRKWSIEKAFTEPVRRVA
jgi:hypothetical protein